MMTMDVFIYILVCGYNCYIKRYKIIFSPRLGKLVIEDLFKRNMEYDLYSEYL